MATEFLRHQSPMTYYDNNRSGCMCGLFKFLHMHKHIHRSKMLSFRGAKHKLERCYKARKHGDIDMRFIKLESETRKLRRFYDGKQGRLEKNDISAEKEPMLDKKAVMQMENKACAKKRNSGPSKLMTSLYKKMIKKKNHKLKVSSSSPHLTRTFSMHHLECNDYVLHNTSSSVADPSQFDSSSVDLDLSENENIAESPKHIKGSSFDKQHIKDATKENIKMDHLITLDGVLDKIPIDQKMNGTMQGDRRSKFGSEGYVKINSRLAKRTIQRSHSLNESLEKYSDSLEGQTFFLRSYSVNNGDNTVIAKRTLRSPSLTESFEIYSRLLESASVRDNQQHYQRLSSVKEHDDNYAHGKASLTYSLSGSLDVYSRILESVSTTEHKKQRMRLRSVKDDVISDSELRLFSLGNDASNGISLQSIEKQEADIGLFSNVEGTEDGGEKIVDQTGECKYEISGIQNQSELINEHNQSGKIKFNTVSPIYTCNKVAKLQSNCICFEESGNSKSVDTTYSCDDNNHDFTIEDLEFEYVKKILMNSRFCEGLNEFLSAWYSSYELGDQLLFVDEESIKDEIFSDVGLDHRLFLLDLVNEVLMEFYEHSIASIMGLSRYSASVKPLFVGDNLIQEVWKRVNSHLITQNDICDSSEWEETTYFMKTDGWTNLLFEVEGVGIEMESLILDDLIDELVDDCYVCD